MKSISEKTLCGKSFTRKVGDYFYMKIILTIIPTNLVKNSLRSPIKFSPSWGSSNEKYFCCLSKTSRALL